MKLIVLAGGKGTRMGSLTANLPKPMVRLAGKPILEHQVELARRYGFTDIHILTGHLGEAIEDYFGDGSRWNVRISYTREQHPLGTAGAVKQLALSLDGDFLVFYGDVMMDVDLAALAQCHRDRGPVATIVVHPNDHPYDSDLVEANGEDRVTAIYSKPHALGVLHRNLVSAALYCLSPRVLAHVEEGVPADFGRDIFQRLVSAGEAVQAYNTREYIKDIGTVQRLAEVEADVYAGRVARFNRTHALGAVFLDRDGVLNPDDSPVQTSAQMTLLPGVAQAVRTLNKSERLTVVVTNQPMIAKGQLSEDGLTAVHAKLESLLSEGGAYLDRIWYCPHHPERGHQGERPEYKVECDCRKPRTGMLERATASLNIDLTDSFIIGDRTVDVMTGRNAGITTILVRTGCGGADGLMPCDPDFVCDDLADATRFIEERFPALVSAAEQLLDTMPKNPAGRTMIAISGFSRTGKTTLSAVLRHVLTRRGVGVKHLRLDHWIVGVDEREPGGSVRDRYRYPEIVDAVERLLRGEPVEYARYDAAARGPDGRRETLLVGEREVLLVDGTVALDLPELRSAASLRIYVELPENLRKGRILAFYGEKGFEKQAAEALYEERQISEQPVILESRRFADHVINLESLS